MILRTFIYPTSSLLSDSLCFATTRSKLFYSRRHSPSDDPYLILGVSPGASASEIRAAYLKLAKSAHPDLNPGDAKSAVRFARIAQAYQLLASPSQRRAHDANEGQFVDVGGHAGEEGEYEDEEEEAQRRARRRREEWTTRAHFGAGHHARHRSRPHAATTGQGERPPIPYAVYFCLAISTMFVWGAYSQAKNNIIRNRIANHRRQAGVMPTDGEIRSDGERNDSIVPRQKQQGLKEKEENEKEWDADDYIEWKQSLDGDDEGAEDDEDGDHILNLSLLNDSEVSNDQFVKITNV